MASNAIKIKQGKIQIFTWNNFSKVFIQIPGTYKAFTNYLFIIKTTIKNEMQNVAITTLFC